MSTARFKSNRPAFFRRNDAFIDMVLGHMAVDMEIALKTSSGMPVKTGSMKSRTRSFKVGNRRYRTEVDTEYAAVQEAGRRAGAKPFRKYTTPGTGKGFFMRAKNSIISKKEAYVEEAARALNL